MLPSTANAINQFPHYAPTTQTKPHTHTYRTQLQTIEQKKGEPLAVRPSTSFRNPLRRHLQQGFQGLPATITLPRCHIFNSLTLQILLFAAV